MATQEQIQSFTAVADADLKANQFNFVKITGDDEIGIIAARADDAVGVLQNKPGEATEAAGEAAEIAYAGFPKVVAGETIAAGNKITSLAGTGLVADTTGDVVHGIALTGAATGELFRIKLGVNNISL